MISIVICSRTPEISNDLRENIRKTIGTEYELLIVDNSSGNLSIFSAYNEGVRRAKGAIICFMHDDIKYKSLDWGKTVDNLFSADDRLGLLGIQACCFLPDTPSYWCDSPFLVYKEGKYNSFETNPILEAVAVDGLWFCIRAELFDRIRFDDVTFSGFHFYDMDICMQVLSLDYKVCVADIELDHFRAGPGVNEMFYTNEVLFFNKWKGYLPIHRGITEPPIVLDMIANLMRHANHCDLLIDKLMKEKDQILHSKAYRLGKALLKPFSFVSRIIGK